MIFVIILRIVKVWEIELIKVYINECNLVLMSFVWEWWGEEVLLWKVLERVCLLGYFLI